MTEEPILDESKFYKHCRQLIAEEGSCDPEFCLPGGSKLPPGFLKRLRVETGEFIEPADKDFNYKISIIFILGFGVQLFFL